MKTMIEKAINTALACILALFAALIGAAVLCVAAAFLLPFALLGRLADAFEHMWRQPEPNSDGTCRPWRGHDRREHNAS